MSFHFLHMNTHTSHNSFIGSDEGLTLETSALKTHNSGQFALSNQLIKQNYIERAATRIGKKIFKFQTTTTTTKALK